LYDPSTGKFSSTGSMAGGHDFGTVTLLADGRVLVAGGSGNNSKGEWVDTASAEIYDPAAGTFGATGPMKQARSGQTAALLQDGRVLVAGGASGHFYVTSAELYDPKTDKFSATGSMPVAGGGTATLLRDGRVLLLAGEGTNTSPATLAEIYDPKTGKFTKGAPFSSAGYTTATVLLDGRVLITGGAASLLGNQNAVASSWTYDPGTGKFTPTGSMTTARLRHTAALLPDGRVLIAGGSASALTGTVNMPDGLKSAELYDPVTGTFMATGSMTTPRSGPTATLLADGTVLITGGSPGGAGSPASFQLSATAELYQP
jgi:hypothetical protein